MSTIRTIVKKKAGALELNKYGETSLYVQYGHNSRQCLFSTGVHVFPEELNWVRPSNRLPFLDQKHPIARKRTGHTVLNAVVIKKRIEIEELTNKLMLQGIDPIIDVVRNEHQKLKRGKTQASRDLLMLFDRYIEERATTSAESTTKKFRTSYNHFKAYLEWSEQFFNPEIITQDLYHDFVNYLITQKHLMNNSVGVIIKNWRVFLRYLENTGYKFNADLSNFKVFSEQSQIIALTTEELHQLEKHEFSGNKSLDQVRDVFIISCYTGYRYSEIRRFTKDQLVDGKINLTAFRNTEAIWVPLMPQVQQIFEKYQYKLPSISLQKFNDYIKQTCETAGIRQYVETLTTSGGRKIIRTTPKHYLISANKAINTFINLCKANEMPVALVAQITGKSSKSIQRHYNQVPTGAINSQFKRIWLNAEIRVKNK